MSPLGRKLVLTSIWAWGMLVIFLEAQETLYSAHTPGPWYESRTPVLKITRLLQAI